MVDKGQKPAPKRQTPTKARKPIKKAGNDEREDTLQAVVLADSFETRYNPFTLERPRCLLPLANTPLIEYTLEFLAMSGVSEIYVYCGAHTSEVEGYLTTSKWHPSTSSVAPFSVLEILKSAARSVGDAMRDIDRRGLITGDFLLVHGDLISNLQIDAALSAHRERRIADKNVIMTLILRESGLGSHRTKSNGVTPVFITDPIKLRCLHYEEISPLQASKYINIDPDLLSEHSDIDIRTDLIDCGIDICTPDVLALWSESFDYEIPRRHFLHGVLKDYELNGKLIYTEIVRDNYAARASTLQAYDAISKDVLGRWTYPLVPDSNLVQGQSYKYTRGGVCKEDGVILARSCRVGKRSVIGHETSIGDGSIISNSILGRRCKIGKNVSIENAYIWDDVVIGDGATVERAIIASEAVIGSGVYIRPGALLSFGTRIANSIVIKEGSRITRARRRQADVEGEPLSQVASDTIIVGASGDGYAFHDSDESDADDSTILQSSLVYSTAHMNLSNSSISTISSEVISPTSPTSPRSRVSSFIGSVSDDDDGTLTDGSASGENFHKDAVADVYKTLIESGDFHNTRVEFTSLRLSNNATDHHVHRAIAVAYDKHISSLVESSNLDVQTAVSKTLDTPGAVSFLTDVAIGKDKKNRTSNEADFLLCAQKDLAHRQRGEGILFALCKELYEREIVEEEGFETWWESEKGQEAEIIEVRKRAEVFIQWLREAEEEGSEDEDDGEEV